MSERIFTGLHKDNTNYPAEDIWGTGDSEESQGHKKDAGKPVINEQKLATAEDQARSDEAARNTLKFLKEQQQKNWPKK